jgi:hypothetical protein
VELNNDGLSGFVKGTLMWNSIIQFHFKKVWFIWGSIYITVPESIKKLDNFKLFKKRIKILTIEPFLLRLFTVVSEVGL